MSPTPDTENSGGKYGRMTATAAAARAVKEMDGVLAGRVADRLRNRGATYEQTYVFVCSACEDAGVSIPDRGTWDALLYHADTQE